MGVLNKLYTFVANSAIESAKVNTNFDDVINFVNNQVVHVDGTKAMTAPLSLPSDPTASNQAARKAYVDSKALTAETNANTSANAGLLSRLKGANASMAGLSGSVNPTTTQMIYQAGSTVVNPNGGGDAVIGFASMNVLTILVANGDALAASTAALSVVSNNMSGFTVHTDSNPSGSIRVNWLAIGW